MSVLSWLRRALGRAAVPAPGRQPPAGEEAAHFAEPSAWVPVSSSWVHSIAYHGGPAEATGVSGRLRVRFKDKRSGVVRAEVEYHGIPRILYAGFLGASSKGKFVHAHLFGRAYSVIWSRR